MGINVVSSATKINSELKKIKDILKFVHKKGKA